MRNTKEMLQDITDAMNRAGELATFSEDATEKQRAFYGMVSEPLQLGSSCGEDTIRSIVHQAMKIAVRLILENATHLPLIHSLDYTDFTATNTTTKGNFYITVTDVEEDTLGLQDVLRVSVEIPRAIKHTKALALIIETLLEKIKNHKKLAVDFDLYNECFTDAWLQYRVKLLANEIKANTGTMWMYFTDNNYYEHYKALSDTQSLHSCMAYTPEHYGSLINGTYIHPLQGYDYAPDFRLGLVSTYSPSEIDDVTEYPFIAVGNR